MKTVNRVGAAAGTDWVPAVDGDEAGGSCVGQGRVWRELHLLAPVESGGTSAGFAVAVAATRRRRQRGGRWLVVSPCVRGRVGSERVQARVAFRGGIDGEREHSWKGSGVDGRRHEWEAERNDGASDEEQAEAVPLWRQGGRPVEGIGWGRA